MSSSTPHPSTAVDVVPKLFQILSPLPPDERLRAISAVMILFGGPLPTNAPIAGAGTQNLPLQPVGGISAKAISWMGKNGLTTEQLEHVFSIETDSVDVIAAKLPGASKRQQTIEAYLVCGLAGFVRSGEPSFTDQDARNLCQRVGCFWFLSTKSG